MRLYLIRCKDKKLIPYSDILSIKNNLPRKCAFLRDILYFHVFTRSAYKRKGRKLSVYDLFYKVFVNANIIVEFRMESRN